MVAFPNWQSATAAQIGAAISKLIAASVGDLAVVMSRSATSILVVALTLTLAACADPPNFCQPEEKALTKEDYCERAKALLPNSKEKVSHCIVTMPLRYPNGALVSSYVFLARVTLFSEAMGTVWLLWKSMAAENPSLTEWLEWCVQKR